MDRIKCLIIDDEAIARDVLRSHLRKIESIDIVAECSSALKAYPYLRNQTIDLIFLDIQMPEISGISFAKTVNNSTKIIFTTAYREYAVEGFELSAVDYLLKPISLERLIASINKYFNIYHSQNAASENFDERYSDFLFVRTNRKMVKIDHDSILYIESYSDYIKIHLERKTVVTRETISAIEKKLPSHKFLRIHRSYIVAINQIHSYTNDMVKIGTKNLTISRSYKSIALGILNSY